MPYRVLLLITDSVMEFIVMVADHVGLHRTNYWHSYFTHNTILSQKALVDALVDTSQIETVGYSIRIDEKKICTNYVDRVYFKRHIILFLTLQISLQN